MSATTSLRSEPNALYRFWDRENVLLYVGITADPGARWKTHSKEKLWWSEVAKVTVEHFPDRDSVLAAEIWAITTEKPLYNIQHNQRGPRRRLVSRAKAGPPQGARNWRFHHRRSGFTWEVPLWLYWEVDGDPITDDYLPDEIDAVELWDLWRRDHKPSAIDLAVYGPHAAHIGWWVEGPQTLEMAPFQDPRGFDYLPDTDFLESFTWPVDVLTGEPLRWLALPVIDKLWSSMGHRKGGFIQEATGWKPSPLQPYMDVQMLEQAARL